MYLYIKGMSQSRKNIIGDLEEEAVPLVEHLVSRNWKFEALV